MKLHTILCSIVFVSFVSGESFDCKLPSAAEILADNFATYHLRNARGINTPHNKLVVTDHTIKILKNVLKETLPELRKGNSTKTISKSYFSLSKYIFELDQFPTYIIKAVVGRNNGLLTKYRDNKTKAHAVLIKNNLRHLIVPAAQIIHLKDTHGDFWTIIIEEKASICPGYQQQQKLYEHLFSQVDENKSFFDYFKLIFRELAIFICLTGFTDSHYNNMALENFGKGIVLPDLDFEFITPDPKVTHPAVIKGLVELLFHTDTQFFETIIDAAAEATQLSTHSVLQALLKHCDERFPKTATTSDLLFQISSHISRHRTKHQFFYKGMAVLETFNTWWNGGHEEEKIW